MARFPKIDSPCPLGQDELAQIAGHCGRCNRTVHCLDGMDDAARADFMRQAKGPICVSYRLPIALGAALALSMAAPAMARDVTSSHGPPRHVVAGPTRIVSPIPLANPVPRAQTVPEPVFVTGGGVHDPAAAQWTDDLSVLELPTVADDGGASK